MSDSQQNDQELKREYISDDMIRYQVGDKHYDVHVKRIYFLHGHFGEFSSLEQVETVIRKMEANP